MKYNITPAINSKKRNMKYNIIPAINSKKKTKYEVQHYSS